MYEHLLEKQWRYKLGLWIGIGTWILQMLVYFFFADSKSLLGDALHALGDNVVILGVVMLTGKELISGAKTHQRIEQHFTRLAILLLFLSALFVAFEGAGRILTPEKFPGIVVLAATAIAAVGSFFIHRSISGIDKSVQDHKHKAGVLHVLADLFISGVVLVAVLLTILFDAPAIDGWGAIIAATWMITRGIMLWRESGKEECAEGHHTHHHNHHH